MIESKFNILNNFVVKCNFLSVSSFVAIAIFREYIVRCEHALVFEFASLFVIQWLTHLELDQKIGKSRKQHKVGIVFVFVCAR